MSQREPKASYWQEAPMPREQLVLFADSLENRIPKDHPVRILDELLDLLDWSEWESEYHGSFGQPPIHPSVLCKILLFAITRGIRSSRKIEYNVSHSIDFIWLASGRTIDHTTLSRFRRDHKGRLKKIYRDMVRLAINLKAAKLSELCIDGSRVLANANRYRTLTAKKAERLIEELDKQIASALGELESSDELEEFFDDGQPADKLPESLRDMKERQKQLQAALEKLQQMDAERASWVKDPEKNPAQLPVTDPDSRILPNKEGGYAANFTPMAVTETVHGFIVGADVLIGNVEHACMPGMIERIEEEFGQKVEMVMADTAYPTGPNLTEMERLKVELLAPLAEPKCKDNPALREDPTEPVAEEDVDGLPVNSQTKRFDKTAFVYDPEQDCYCCPAGKKLPRSGSEKKKKKKSGEVSLQMIYTCRDCAGCPLADRCRTDPNAKKGRRVTHDVHEAARRRHRERMKRPEATADYKRRQHIGETPFAVLKACFGLRQFLLRGIEGVQTEWLWHCTAFNLKKLMSLWGSLRDELPKNAQAALV